MILTVYSLFFGKGGTKAGKSCSVAAMPRFTVFATEVTNVGTTRLLARDIAATSKTSISRETESRMTQIQADKLTTS
jgi:hypothetical protein